MWNTWWLRYALFDLGQNPLYSTHTFYPLGISLAFYTYNLFNAIVSLPLQPFLPLAATSNLTFLFATVFSGYGTFLLVLHLFRGTRADEISSGDHGEQATSRTSGYLYVAACLSGLIYAFGSYRMVYAAIGHYNLWSTTWIPFYTLYLLRTIYRPRLRNALLGGIFLFGDVDADLPGLCDSRQGTGRGGRRPDRSPRAAGGDGAGHHASVPTGAPSCPE